MLYNSCKTKCNGFGSGVQSRTGACVPYGLYITQPRPQGLPRGGARAEEDPGKIR
jgi:hypothetical protein